MRPFFWGGGTLFGVPFTFPFPNWGFSFGFPFNSLPQGTLGFWWVWGHPKNPLGVFLFSLWGAPTTRGAPFPFPNIFRGPRGHLVFTLYPRVSFIFTIFLPFPFPGGKNFLNPQKREYFILGPKTPKKTPFFSGDNPTQFFPKPIWVVPPGKATTKKGPLIPFQLGSAFSNFLGSLVPPNFPQNSFGGPATFSTFFGFGVAVFGHRPQGPFWFPLPHFLDPGGTPFFFPVPGAETHGVLCACGAHFGGSPTAPLGGRGSPPPHFTGKQGVLGGQRVSPPFTLGEAPSIGGSPRI